MPVFPLVTEVGSTFQTSDAFTPPCLRMKGNLAVLRARLPLTSVFVICAAAAGCGGGNPTHATVRVTSEYRPFGSNAEVLVNGAVVGKLPPDGSTGEFQFVPKAGLNTIGLRIYRGESWEHSFLIKPGEDYALRYRAGWSSLTIVSRSDEGKPAAAEVVRKAEEDELNAQIEVVMKEHAPELHDAITRIDQEWRAREARCEQLAQNLKKLNRDPGTDGDLQRWRQAIGEMKGHLADLRKKREDAYLAFKKFELAPTGKEDYDRRLRLAKAAAADSQEYHKKMQIRLESQ